MGLFTFYKMQEQKQTQQVNASITNPEIKNNKLAPFPK